MGNGGDGTNSRDNHEQARGRFRLPPLLACLAAAAITRLNLMIASMMPLLSPLAEIVPIWATVYQIIFVLDHLRRQNPTLK